MVNMGRNAPFIISNMMRLIFVLLFTSMTSVIFSQKEIPLYEGKVPNSRTPGKEQTVTYNKEAGGLMYNVSDPTLTIYLPPADKAGDAAVIICPGGGYHLLVTGREGSDIALEFNKLGVAAFVLKYRLPDDRIMVDKSVGPLQDAQRALQIVREGAAGWNINPDKIGIMGFSAGGHLASTAGTHFEKALIENKSMTSLRPDFMILVYPVISLSDSLCHAGSREYLLGKNPSAEQIRFFSNDLYVNEITPPSFLILADDDSVVKPENSIIFYEALRRNGVPAEMHIYETGEHGFLKDPPFEEWFGRCCFWMKSNGWLQVSE
jgi:acetyl esterase/lipase